MLIMGKTALEKLDVRSGKSVDVLIDEYYDSGYRSFRQFYDAQPWDKLLRTESDPDAVVINGRLHSNAPDSLPAKQKLLEHACELIDKEKTTYLEFGVRAGRSMGWVTGAMTNPDSTFHGFDTFKGLPEAWVPAWGGSEFAGARAKGEMAAKMPRIADKRVKLFRGLIQDTLCPWMRDHDLGGRLFLNIDTDLYSAALYVLTLFHPYLKAGDIVHFDEFHDELNEFAAFNDYIRSFYRKDSFELLGRAYDAYLFRYTGPGPLFPSPRDAGHGFSDNQTGGWLKRLLGY